MKTLKSTPNDFPNLSTYLCFLVFIFFASNNLCFSQVGINTTTPDASAMLDINATDKGLLIPRVSLVNVTITMLDGINTAATGLLIYNTNASVIGGDGVGYYTFNGTTWERLTTSATNVEDKDWFEEGTTNAPDAITDDIFTQGNVAIGKNTADYSLDIQSNSNRGINTLMDGTNNSNIYGHYIRNANTGSGVHYGTHQELTGEGAGAQHGTYNDITSVANATMSGVYNEMAAGGAGTHYGLRNQILGSGSGTLYGTNTSISNSGVGTHYGNYNSLSGAGNGGHFGINNTIGGIGNGDHYGNKNTLTGAGTGAQLGVDNNITNTGSGVHYGLRNTINNNGDGTHYGVYNNLDGTGTGKQYGVYNTLSNNGGDTKYANYSILSGTGSGAKYGYYATISPATGGTHYGVYSNVLKAGSFAGYFLGQVTIGTNNSNKYIFPASRGTASQIMQTDASGNVTWVDATSVGNDDHDWYEEGTTNAPDAITDDIFTQGNVAIGKNIADYTLDIETTGPRGINVLVNGSDNPDKYGNYQDIVNTGSGFHYGTYTALSGTGTGGQYGTYNSINNTGNGLHLGTNNRLIGTGAGTQIGTRQTISNTGNGDHYGSHNILQNAGSGEQFGTRQEITNTGNGDHFGSSNILSGGGTGSHYGSYQQVNSSGSGNHYGTYNTLFGTSTGDKYGSYNFVSNVLGGTHYGVYSEVLKTGSYAGYFLGNVAIGTSAANKYILPASRGIANQIMQTDGSGNVTWVDASSLNDHDFYESGTATPPNNITDNIFHTGDISIGVDTNGAKLTVQDVSNNLDAALELNRTSTTANTYALKIKSDTNAGGGGIYNEVDGNVSATISQYGLYNDLSGVTGSNRSGIGVYNDLSSNEQIYLSGVSNSISGSGTLNKIGFSNYWVNSANGNLYGYTNTFNGATTYSKFGIYSVFGQSNDGTLTGAFHEFRSTTSSTKYGVQNRFMKFNSGSPAPDGTMYGVYNIFDGAITGIFSKYGVYNIIPNTTAGVNYGIYSDVKANNSYSGYFLGRVSVGTTTANNYIFPLSRGGANQIMQTDGSGNVTWVNNPSASFWSRTGTELDVATSGDDIHFNSDQTSIIFPNTNGTPSSMIYMFESAGNVDRMVLSHSPSYPAWGLEYEDATDSFIFKSSTAERVEIDLNGGYPLRVYGTARAVDFESNTTTYPDYVFENYYKGASKINSEYSFKTLSEVETFIKKEGHLPGVKSFEEVKKEGMTINLAETSVSNLEKIEELFLYAIEMKKENDQLKEKQKTLEERLAKIEAAFQKNN